MIPALLALPFAQSALGSVAGGLASTLGGVISNGAQTFGQQFNSLTNMGQPSASTVSPSGTLQSSQWNQMNSSQLQAWGQALVGKHVDSTDIAGNAISGLVSGIHQANGITTMEIGGHLVTLSQMNQISWSPSAT
jgi:hypothetical protein